MIGREIKNFATDIDVGSFFCYNKKVETKQNCKIMRLLFNKEKSYFKRYEFEKGIIIEKMDGLNTNDELKMNISKSIVDLYFKETSSWFYKEEKECWDKLSLTLKELDTKLEDVKLKKIFWFIVFNIFVFWNEDNNFIILQVRKFVDKRDLDRGYFELISKRLLWNNKETHP